MSFIVEDAKREKLKAAVALMGPSGSGKTLGALLMAFGMMKEKYPDLEETEVWKKVALIDTEHKRSKVYVDLEKAGVYIRSFKFINFEKPYTVERYDQAVKMAVSSGAEVVIIDSASHAWEGDGGLLDLQQEFGGRYQDWKHVNPHYRLFIDLMVGERYDVHTISTIRLKQKHEVDTTETGKLEVKKLGLQPVMRDSLEYELQVAFNVDMDHVARTSKDNSGFFEENPHRISPETGSKLFKWLEVGVDVAAEERKEKKEKLVYLKQLAKDNTILAAYMTDLEEKAKMPMDAMPIKFLRKMFDLVETKVAQIEEQKKQNQESAKQAEEKKPKKEKEKASAKG